MNIKNASIKIENLQSTPLIIIILILLYFKEDLNSLIIIIIIIIFFCISYIINNKDHKDHKLTKYFLNNKEKQKNYTNKIENNLKRLKKYKKYENYNEGLFYWKKFIKILKKLENDNINLYNQYFENAEQYFKQSINLFQSIGTNINERTYIDGLHLNDFKEIKNTNKIDKIVKELYNEGYLLLYNLSIRLNQRWKKNPNINNKQIYMEILPYHNVYNNDKLKFYI